MLKREMSEESLEGILNPLGLGISQENPILAQKVLKGEELGRNVPMLFMVYGGLNVMENQAPYFSLTYWAHRNGFVNQCEQGGAGHDEILKRYPQFADLAALHLATIDGVPMYAVENGWYWLRGALEMEGSASQKGPYSNAKTKEECLQNFRDLWRLSETETGSILKEFSEMEMKGDSKQAAAKEVLVHKALEMQPRWKAEADKCIEHHHLKLFGPGLDALLLQMGDLAATPEKAEASELVF